MNYRRIKAALRGEMEDWNHKHPKDQMTIARMSRAPFWGGAAKTNFYRLSEHMKGLEYGPRPTPQLINLLFPQTPAQKLRARIVAGYHSILGAVEGGSIQRAIAAWCGLSRFEPWCAETWWYVTKHLAGYDGPGPDNPFFVPSIELWAKAKGILVPFRKGLPGMGITFVWDGRRGIGRGDHVGILVKKTLTKAHILINPRTSEANASSDRGDAVIITTRYWWQVNTIFDPAQLQRPS